MVITADQINLIEHAKNQLFDCTTKEEAERVFNDYRILDIDARTTLLHRCMQVKNVYGTYGEVTPQEFYEETLDFFEDGQWREFI